jgi:hypothetical protein
MQLTTTDYEAFPDGLITSGQHSPIESQLHPYSEFPKKVDGPALWDAKDYAGHDEKWKKRFSAEEISEISKAADHFIASGVPLTGMAKVSSLSAIGM